MKDMCITFPYLRCFVLSRFTKTKALIPSKDPPSTQLKPITTLEAASTIQKKSQKTVMRIVSVALKT